MVSHLALRWLLVIPPGFAELVDDGGSAGRARCRSSALVTTAIPARTVLPRADWPVTACARSAPRIATTGKGCSTGGGRLRGRSPGRGAPRGRRRAGLCRCGGCRRWPGSGRVRRPAGRGRLCRAMITSPAPCASVASGRCRQRGRGGSGRRGYGGRFSGSGRGRRSSGARPGRPGTGPRTGWRPGPVPGCVRSPGSGCAPGSRPGG
jgi:hypothetical protein